MAFPRCVLYKYIYYICTNLPIYYTKTHCVFYRFTYKINTIILIYYIPIINIIANIDSYKIICANLARSFALTHCVLL